MSKHTNAQTVLDKRRTGVLLHPTSLPGPGPNGDLGPEAYHFVDFLANCGASVWQMLPLVPTHEDKSPYMGLSVLAGNAELISLELLNNWGWLNPQDITISKLASAKQKHHLIKLAYQGFRTRALQNDRDELEEFTNKHTDWLTDYALFQALRSEYGQVSWPEWPEAIRDREPEAIKQALDKHHDAIKDIVFEQYVFYKQWGQIKQYAHERGILMFGDMPIFVAHDSAEVWANREQFDLLKSGKPRVITGVPPDYFSATGQRWGNPHYKWKQMRADGFSWWQQRIHTCLELFDLVRVDHFRGFESVWEIKANEETAINGRWVKTPGKALFNALMDHFGSLPFVAEDLGTITPEVLELRDRYAWPGMRILQFAFDGNVDNPYLPHNYCPNSVVYTGTHDNDTSLGWYTSLSDDSRRQVDHYLGFQQEEMPWRLIRTALASTAKLAVIPMQDLLGLDSSHRMNTPGQTGENWAWRFNWTQVGDAMPAQVRELSYMYGRLDHNHNM